SRDVLQRLRPFSPLRSTECDRRGWGIRPSCRASGSLVSPRESPSRSVLALRACGRTDWGIALTGRSGGCVHAPTERGRYRLWRREKVAILLDVEDGP